MNFLPAIENPWDLLDWIRSNPIQHEIPESTAQYGKLTEDAKVYGDVEIQPYTLISGTVITGKNCFIGPFCLIRGPVVLGDNVVIGPHCEVARSIIKTGSIIAHKNIVLDSVLEENVQFAGFVSNANKAVKGYVTVCYEGKSERRSGSYGVYVQENSIISGMSGFAPGATLPPNSRVLKPSFIFGNGKTTAMLDFSL